MNKYNEGIEDKRAHGSAFDNYTRNLLILSGPDLEGWLLFHIKFLR